ncbi:hypothetical protein EGW08_003720, partial [Elysia chlorotica]
MPVGKSTGVYNGVAYAKDGDLSVTLLYDVNGFIAGIQHGSSREVYGNLGFPSVKLQPPFNLVDNRYVLTAYFVDPSTICTSGRTQADFDSDGTGTGLWIQNGSTPDQVTQVPYYQTGLSGTNWTEGKCFISMGKHYWYNVHPDTECDAFFPVFTLYNGGILEAFGWAFLADLSSSFYEHPTRYSAFMKVVPDCIRNLTGRFSTMHIFFTYAPEIFNMC